jgi:hypothetical protein
VIGSTLTFPGPPEAAAWLADLDVPSHLRTGQNLAEALRITSSNEGNNFSLPPHPIGGVRYGTSKMQSANDAYRNFSLSDAYLENSTQTAMTGARAFLQSVSLDDIQQNWSGYTEQEKLELLQKMHDAVAEAYHVPPVRVEAESVDPAEAMAVSNASYNDERNALVVNLHPSINDNDPRYMLASVFHETIHRKQDYTSSENNRSSEANSSFPADMSMIWANSLDGNYVRASHMGWNAYIKNPREEEALNVTNSLKREFGILEDPLQSQSLGPARST